MNFFLVTNEGVRCIHNPKHDLRFLVDHYNIKNNGFLNVDKIDQVNPLVESQGPPRERKKLVKIKLMRSLVPILGYG